MNLSSWKFRCHGTQKCLAERVSSLEVNKVHNFRYVPEVYHCRTERVTSAFIVTIARDYVLKGMLHFVPSKVIFQISKCSLHHHIPFVFPQT